MRPRNMSRIATWIFPLLVCSMWMLASGSAAADDDDLPQFTAWSAPVNLGPPVNSIVEEGDPFISKDGLSLYFARPGQAGGFGGWDIWVSQRTSVDDPWGTPQNLGPSINTTFDEFSPVVSVDGHRLYFTSNRPGGLGGNDSYVARRHNKRDDFGWQLPENLGSGVNTTANEAYAMPFEDDETGVITLYFASDRPGSLDDDIYASTFQPDETFGPAVLVQELSSPSRDRHPNIRRDGLEIFFMSNRPGSVPNILGRPSFDLWVSTRASTSDPWSTPVNVGPVVNGPTHDGHPSLSFDGTTLYFFSARPGNVSPLFDIWVTTRTKLPELEQENE